eukprot:Protomagalhaensia_sp_Gyna_25__2141@NODE_215_length_4354_cov_151_446350_g167_i0_p1_GENE_NODE_215_length_4354_cov_151_446350_g167_i0NODE_215_length_4354_cov_151_446350_g167_i0_p1_ORF_typecomplete_len817_score135_98Peptidase_C14/PF00656_22/5_5e16Redoxin/PF08534_10/8_4e14AhpCTSA/PF00578_21/0_00066_NODE_215_length_4354_cov_151_446350_g167_i017064156
MYHNTSTISRIARPPPQVMEVPSPTGFAGALPSHYGPAALHGAYSGGSGGGYSPPNASSYPSAAATAVSSGYKQTSFATQATSYGKQSIVSGAGGSLPTTYVPSTTYAYNSTSAQSSYTTPTTTTYGAYVAPSQSSTGYAQSATYGTGSSFGTSYKPVGPAAASYSQTSKGVSSYTTVTPTISAQSGAIYGSSYGGPAYHGFSTAAAQSVALSSQGGGGLPRQSPLAGFLPVVAPTSAPAATVQSGRSYLYRPTGQSVDYGAGASLPPPVPPAVSSPTAATLPVPQAEPRGSVFAETPSMAPKTYLPPPAQPIVQQRFNREPEPEQFVQTQTSHYTPHQQQYFPPTEETKYAADMDVPRLAPEHCTPIAVGDKLPTAHIDLHGVCVNLQEFFEDRCGILFGVVGAFNPIDTDKAVPEIQRCMESFEKQVDFVGCLVVNDPFVVKAWAKRLKMTDQLIFVADADAKFTKALGMAQYLPEKGLGVRSRRFALVVGPRSKVQWVGFDEDSFASNVLQAVPRFVRTPWKSFIVGISYDKKKPEQTTDTHGAEGGTSGGSIAEAISSMRVLLAQQGFCAEPDWQLMLSDTIPEIFKPTRENIMSGLKWLVEGTQAGDVLCLYFAGRAQRIVNADGTETRGLLPMDYETAGMITEAELYEILAANVPEYCRMTIILDIEGEDAIQCPLPYCAPCPSMPAPDGPYAGTLQLLPMSAPNQAWATKFQQDETPRGEVLSISLEGSDRVPPGCLATLMNASSNAELRSEESDQLVEAPVSFKEKLERMTAQLQEWGMQKYVMFGSSFPLDLKEDFSLVDILPAATK